MNYSDDNEDEHSLTQISNIENQPGLSEPLLITSTDAMVYKNRAHVRYEIDDYEGAITNCNQAIKINPDDADAYYYRGQASYALGDYEGANADFTQTIRLNPLATDVYFKRGQTRDDLDDKQAAITDFKTAAEVYHKAGKMRQYKQARQMSLDLEIEESLDILNF